MEEPSTSYAVRDTWLASDPQDLELVPVKEAGVVLVLTALFPVLRWVLERLVFMPLARVLLIPRQLSRTKAIPESTKKRIQKFSESQWKLFCYGSFTILGLRATYNQPWLWNTRECWTGWPQQHMTVPMRLLYACETSYYLATVLMLALWEVPRKDFHVMMTHHLATVVSIIFTYKYNYTRIGCVVMLLHDINDVLMEIAKSFNYLQLDTAATCTFAAFVASWAALRIYAFPVHCIYSSFVESWQILGYRPPCHGLLNALLMALYCIHIYWFTLIIRIAWRKLTTGVGRDIREDSDDE